MRARRQRSGARTHRIVDARLTRAVDAEYREVPVGRCLIAELDRVAGPEQLTRPTAEDLLAAFDVEPEANRAFGARSIKRRVCGRSMADPESDGCGHSQGTTP